MCEKFIIIIIKSLKILIIILIFSILYYIYFIFQYFNNSNQIFLENIYRDNQGYHPKVIYFNESWNGYKYWMAYTPYNNANCRKENPTINASNNLTKWYTPKGLKNPLDIPKDVNHFHYNSDTHILYNIDTKKLEVFWRYYNKENNKKIKIIIYKMTSKNGIFWSKKKVFLKSENRLKHDYISPTIIYEKGIYKIWYVNHKKIHYLEKEGKIIKNNKILNITFENNYYPWHLDIIFNKKKNIYEMVVCAYIDNFKNHDQMPLFYSSSKNNIIWNKPIIIMKPSKNLLKWDSKGIYRSCLLYENGYYYLFYSGHNIYKKTGIGLMYGKRINHLKPYI